MGLGTFTLSESTIEMGTQGTIVKHTPVFVLSERFANRTDVSVRSVNVVGSIPVSNLNMTHLAQETGLQKHQVEACIREVLMALTRNMDDPRGIAMALYGIGWLSVKRRKVRFTFYRRFLHDPKPTIGGRPPTRSDLSSRAQTAGVLGGRPVSRSAAGGQGARPPTRGATPLLFGGNHIPEGAVPHSKIGWQSSLRSDRFVEVVDPMDHSTGSLPYQIADSENRGRYIGANAWKEIHGGAGPIYEEGQPAAAVSDEEIEAARRAMVRGLNVTADAQRQSEDPTSYTFPEKSTDWDTRDGSMLPVLDAELKPHKRSVQKIGITMQPYGTAPKISDEVHANPPKREEAGLFDPLRCRGGCKQSRCDGARLCYVCFQQRGRTPEVAGSAEAKTREAREDRDLMSQQRERAGRAAEVERQLEAAKKQSNMRTAAFNWAAASTQRAQTAQPGGRRSRVPQTDLLFKRPSTARASIRSANRQVAEFQTGQAMATKVQRGREETMQTSIERQVMAVAERQHQAVERNKIERKVAYQKWMKGELDKQVEEKQELAYEAAETERRTYPADVVHFEPAVDAVGFAIERRLAAQEAGALNRQAEAYKYDSLAAEREAQIIDEQNMLQESRAAVHLELEQQREQMAAHSADVRRALGAGHAAKIDRDYEEEYHRALPNQLNVLEQTDRYDQVVPLPLAGAEFSGRSTNVIHETMMKGTGIIA